MDTQGKTRWNTRGWRSRQALIRVWSALSGVALALGLSAGATAQTSPDIEGVHDGAEGVVSAVGCSAFGWAVDPDDPDRDLQVRILADGSSVATVTADLPREDLDACPGGTCGFGVSLWGLVSPGVEHQITARAYDEETEVWVDLSGTPKLLTCWGYPEGFHDGAEGVVDQYSCNANGWAVDPDNRDRDLQVQILADGSPVATVTADLLRADVSACPGGTCGFGANLWGLISPGVVHQITAQAYDEESDVWLNLEATPKSLTCESPPPPSPGLRAFPDQDFVDGSNWTPDQPMQLRIGDLQFGEVASEDGSVGFDLGEFDLLRGEVLTMTSGATTVVYTVRNLLVTGIEPEAQTVSGSLELENGTETVHVFVGQDFQRYVETDSSGNWIADFSDNLVLAPGVCGNAEAWGVGAGSTIVDWCVPMPPPSPFIWADPVNDAVNGWDWPDGETLTFELFDPDGTLLHSESAAIEGGMAYDLRALEIDLQAGYRIVLSTDSFTKELIVTSLAITQYGETTETLQGVFDPTQGFWVDVGGQQPLATEFVDDLWIATFDAVSPGMCGEVAQPDPDGDMTGIGFCVPNPHFTVFPEWEAMELWEWPIGASIVLSIEDPGTAQSPDFENGYAVPPADWNPYESFLWIDIAGVYDVKAGDIVTLTGAGFVVPHTVRPLTVTGIDAAANTVSGTADPGGVVYVWPHDLGHWTAGLPVVTGEDGNWIADLDDLPVPYDLAPWTSGRAEIVDAIGNTTGIDWQVPLPVEIDIQPWSGLNLITCRYPAAMLPVAVLSAEGFDATQLYTDSIRFGRTGTEAEVIRIGREERPVQYATDVNRDGLPDMVYVFRFGDTGFSCADIPAGRRTATLEATLTGWMDGGMVEGSDSLTLFRLSGH